MLNSHHSLFSDSSRLVIHSWLVPRLSSDLTSSSSSSSSSLWSALLDDLLVATPFSLVFFTAPTPPTPPPAVGASSLFVSTSIESLALESFNPSCVVSSDELKVEARLCR